MASARAFFARASPQSHPADADLRRLRQAVRVAEEVGARLGAGALLFRPVPRGREGRDYRTGTPARSAAAVRRRRTSAEAGATM